MIRALIFSIILFSTLMSEEISIGSVMPGSEFIVKNINGKNRERTGERTAVHVHRPTVVEQGAAQARAATTGSGATGGFPIGAIAANGFVGRQSTTG